MFDASKLKKRDGNYGIATGGAVTDQTLLAIATTFENTVMRKILALCADDFAQRFPGNEEVLVAQKYDGEGVFVYFEQGSEPFCFNAPSGRVRVGLPALADLRDKLRAAGVKKALLRAELCLQHGASPERAGISEVTRISFSGSAAELASLRLRLLDVVMLDGQDLRGQQSDFRQTASLLERLAGSNHSEPASAMEYQIVAEREVAQLFERMVGGGGEGLVIRRLNRPELYKAKPQRTVSTVVIGFIEGEAEGQIGVASLLTALLLPGADGVKNFQVFARVGSGLNDALRASLLETLRALVVDAPLAMSDSSGRAVRFVKPQLLAEIVGEDLVHGTALDVQTSQRLVWSESSKSYAFAGLSVCPRLTFARFRALREDQDWRTGGARYAQLGVDPGPLRLRSDQQVPKLLRREVYAKPEMLRKLVVLEQPADHEGFRYLVYWTDYSARRADPLKTTCEYAVTAERAHALAERAVKEGVTRGFVLVSVYPPAE